MQQSTKKNLMYFYTMKVRNDDLVKLNELKFDFLSPPYSFRLASIVVANIDAAIAIMKKYVTEDNIYIEQLKQIKVAIESGTPDMPAIRQLCVEAAAIITYFTAV